MNRKKVKKSARKVLWKHYLIYVAICLIASFIGAEFSSSLNALTGYDSFQQENSDSTGNVTSLVGADTLSLNSIIMRFARNGRKTSQNTLSSMTELVSKKIVDSEMLGRSRGVFAQIANMITSGSLTVTILAGIQSAINSKNILTMILTIFSIALVLLFWIFLQNTYIVMTRRIFLEGRIYSEIPFQRFLFLFRIKKWMKVVWNMLVYKVLYLLWCFTIVGAFTKKYAYAMVPFIIAENPDIKAMEAITLSRNMMYGHKWELFKLDLTLFGWMILGVLTAGATNILFLNPYTIAVYSEYYAKRRAEALKTRMPGAQLMDDRYLFEKATDIVIEAAYLDVINIMKEPVQEIEQMKGLRGFLANVFGVLIAPSEKELEYEKTHTEHMRIKTLAYAVRKESYPYRLYKIPERMKRKKTEAIMYLRHYSIWSLIILFFVFSLVGYIWEVILHLISYGDIVNRGVMHGPWLPIYGSGGVLILMLLNKLRKYPVAEFFSIMALCGTVEYLTSVLLEVVYGGSKWWDYSGYFLNVNGRICAEGLLVFGVTGVIFIYVIAPLLDNMVKRVRYQILIPFCIALVTIFICDMIYSYHVPNIGKGVSVSATQVEGQEEMNQDH